MKRARRLNVDRLEDRALPATFGIPWTDPRHLTVSLAPDQTAISTSQSALFSKLNAQAPTVVWQHEILRAVQSWASVANIDIGLVSDDGAAFGANTGQGATRTAGDIRVGAVNLPATALAIGLPPDPFFGDYWSGEVIYNAANQLNPAQATLFSVFAHEFGHALGMANSSDTASVMYTPATVPASGLAASDIVGIRSLYGVRQPDRHDAAELNGTLNDATNMEMHDDTAGAPPYVGQFPQVAFGDVTSLTDVDYYRIETPVGYGGAITFMMRSEGLSLLAPKLSIYNENGVLLGAALSTDPTGDTITVHLKQSMPDSEYFLRVEGAAADVFGIGRYGVAVTFDAAVTPETKALIPTVLTGPNDQLEEDDLVDLFVRPGQAAFNDDHGGDDDIAFANPLSPVARLFEAVGVIETITDVDFYRVRTPQQTGPVTLTLSTRAQPVNGGTPRIELVTASGQVVPGTILFNGDGRLTVQASNLSPNTDYFVRLRGATPAHMGNYALTVLTSSSATLPQRFSSGSLTTAFREEQLIVVQNQVFHFMLGVTGLASQGLQLTIDGPNGRVYDLTVAGGGTANGRPILLTPGTYTVRYRRVGVTFGPPIGFTLHGAVLSDPIGPALQDPTQHPAGPGSGLKNYYFTALRRIERIFETSSLM